MSPQRFVRELAVMFCVILGAAIGFAAGVNMQPTVQVFLAFLGFSIGGAFAEMCLNRRL